MSKTPFSKKCEILGSFYALYRDSDDLSVEWQEFFSTQDVGLPASFLAWQNMATIQDEGVQYVNDTWNTYCLMIGIDPDDMWEDMEQTFLASSQ